MPKPVRNSPAPNVGAPKPAVESKAAFLAGWAKASGLDATQLRGLASMFEQDFKGANAFRLDQGESYILKYGLQDAAEKLATRPAGTAPGPATAAGTKEELLASTAKALAITRPQLESLAKLLHDDFAGNNVLGLAQGASYSVKYALEDVAAGMKPQGWKP